MQRHGSYGNCSSYKIFEFKVSHTTISPSTPSYSQALTIKLRGFEIYFVSMGRPLVASDRFALQSSNNVIVSTPLRIGKHFLVDRISNTSAS